MPRRIPVQRLVARPDVVLVASLARRRVEADVVTCGGALQTKSGTTTHAIDTFTILDLLRVTVISQSFGFGTTVAVAPQKTPSGYSFQGNTCQATTGDHCKNGELLSTITSVSGTITPAVLEYSYTIELFCGTALSCVENGTFKGSRMAGGGDVPEGRWMGPQTWTSSCCAARNAFARAQPPSRDAGKAQVTPRRLKSKAR